MGKFIFLIFILFVGAIAIFSMSNKDMTTVTVPFDKAYEISKISLVLIASALGALSMLLIFVVRDARRMVATYQFQKKQKKEDRIHGLYSKAMNAMFADNAAEARSLLEDILREDPEHEDTLMRLGDLDTGAERFDEALKHYKKALLASPGNLEAMFSLATLSEKLQRWPEALEYIEGMFERDPGNLSALVLKRSVLEHNTSWDDLVDVQKSIIKGESKAGHDTAKEEAALLGYRYEQARNALEQSQLERAGKGFRKIIRIDSGFVPAYMGVAEVMLREGDSEGSVSFLEKSYEATSSPLILARLEDVLIGMGEPSRLIRNYRSALAADSQNPMLRFFLGKLYYRLEMVDDALETLSTGEIPESYPEWNHLLGELYLRRNQCEKAVEEFKKTIDMKRTLRLPYCCSECDHPDEEWSGRCPSCGRWNTYQFNLHGACKV